MKKTIFLILLCLVGFAKAELAITNGDFELNAPEDGDLADVPEWYEPNPGSFWVGTWVKTNSGSYNGTAVLVLAGASEAVNTQIDGADVAGYCYQGIGTAGGATSLTLSFDWARLLDQSDTPLDIGLTFTILEASSFTPDDETDILGASGVAIVDQVSKVENLETGVTTLDEVWTFDISSAGGGQLYLRINQYQADDAGASWIGLDNIKLLGIEYDSPEDGVVDLAVEKDSAENDLVFTVYDSRIETVDVFLAKYDDPALTEDPNGYGHKIVEGMTVETLQQYTIDLENELSANLDYLQTYYWKVIGYDSSSNAIEGSVVSFTTVPEIPVVYPIDPPLFVSEVSGDVVIPVRGINVVEYQWYKEGQASPLVDGAEYSGTTTNTLTVLDMQLADEGFYYCVGTNSVGSDTNREKGPGKVMIERLVNYYPMETIADGVTPDTVGGADMVLLSDDEEVVGLPVLDADVVDPILGASSLSLANVPENEPNGVYGELPAGVVDYYDITISCWVKWTDDGAWPRIFDFGNNQDEYMFISASAEGNLRFAITNSGGGAAEQRLNLGTVLPADVWTYIAVTLEGDTGKMYVDGEMVDINTGINLDPIDLTPSLNQIGKSKYADRYFEGYIDDFKIYNYPLTTEEIAQEYMDVAGGWVCDYDREDLPYDFNGNCVIDLPDFAIFAATWMDSHRIYNDNN